MLVSRRVCCIMMTLPETYILFEHVCFRKKHETHCCIGRLICSESTINCKPIQHVIHKRLQIKPANWLIQQHWCWVETSSLLRFKTPWGLLKAWGQMASHRAGRLGFVVFQGKWWLTTMRETSKCPIKNIPPSKMKECPIKKRTFHRLQPSILRGYVSFQGAIFFKSVTLEVVFLSIKTWMLGCLGDFVQDDKHVSKFYPRFCWGFLQHEASASGKALGAR